MEISYGRVGKITLGLGLAGTAAVLAKYGIRDAAAFLTGSALSYLSFRSFARLAAGVEASGEAPITGSAIFFALRYVLIGVAIYAIIGGLGISPAALVVGLLVSFVALTLELLWSAIGSP